MIKMQVVTDGSELPNAVRVSHGLAGRSESDLNSNKTMSYVSAAGQSAQYWHDLSRQLPFLGRRWLAALEHIAVGTFRVVTPEGYVREFRGKKAGPEAEIILHSWRALKLFLLKGEVGLSQAYQEGAWSSCCLRSLFTLALSNVAVFQGWQRGTVVARVIQRLGYYFQKNTLTGSKKNIQAHYDLSNEFYALWLDPSMTYSAGVFNNANYSLARAQQEKYDRLLGLLRCQKGHILEIGCGWGGFAERALEKTDVTLTGLTLSPAQLAYAKQRVPESRTQLLLRDYRHENGLFDGIVSIEMFEAVGEAYWPVYFNKIKQCLKPGARAVIQTITIDEEHFERYRAGGDSIRSYIFPGGMLPSVERFTQEAQAAGLTLVECTRFGEDYARTLQLWLEQFESQRSAILAKGFDERFIRLWRYYLATCYAGFKTGRINVIHAVLTHA